jgi:hypothetical protein
MSPAHRRPLGELAVAAAAEVDGRKHVYLYT